MVLYLLFPELHDAYLNLLNHRQGQQHTPPHPVHVTHVRFDVQDLNSRRSSHPRRARM